MSSINSFSFSISAAEWMNLRPLLTIGIGSMVVLLLSTLKTTAFGDKRGVVFLGALLILGIGFAFSLAGWSLESVTAFNGVVALDKFHNFFNLFFCASGILIVLASYKYLEAQKIHYSEYYTLLLLAIFGMMCMTASLELITMFVALEIMSLAVYVLVGLSRLDRKANEAAVKYFVLGGVASAIMLYGISMVYGALNTTNLIDISKQLIIGGDAVFNPVLILGFFMILVGFLFKVAVFPFHIWTPDVYEGAPIIVTSFMSTVLKVASFAAFIRVFSLFVGSGTLLVENVGALSQELIWILAVVTMVVGNFVALTQNNLKRLLAYSAIAHTGYLMIGILVGPKVGYSSILLYMIPYAVMNIGAFAILGMISGKLDKACKIENLTGLGSRHPYLAGALTIFMLSLAGLPPTGGFVAKYFLFSAALEAGQVSISLIAIATSLVSVYYYIRVIIFMYMKEENSELSPVASGGLAWATIALCVWVTLQTGIFPSQYINLAREAALF